MNTEDAALLNMMVLANRILGLTEPQPPEEGLAVELANAVKVFAGHFDEMLHLYRSHNVRIPELRQRITSLECSLARANYQLKDDTLLKAMSRVLSAERKRRRGVIHD